MSTIDDGPTRDPISGIVLLDDHLPYLDGAEQSIRDAIERCADTSSWSDELWREASTWAERYHLSPQRGAILAPLALGPEVRVLEIGAGTGAITRAIGETGATVIAVEGNLDRARIVSARCADLPNVEVMCGPVTSFDQSGSFDVVIGIGILEYSPTGSGGSSGPELLLAHAARQLADDGVLALAIENQTGLKYLIGHNEDHLGLPWVGIEGYQRQDGPRTWSKEELGRLFFGAGLSEQRWAFPFPDYKFPHVILDEGAYRRPDASDLIDALCRWPDTDSADPPHLLCDARAAHRVMLDAGLGPSVANSFLVIAGRNHAALAHRVRPGLAWLTGSRRRAAWQRWRELRPAEDGGLKLVTIRSNEQSKQLSWLRQTEAPEAEWVEGANLEATLLAAIAAGSDESIKKALVGWMTQLEDASVDTGTTDRRPFLDDETQRVLPGDMIDSNFSNWVVDDAGRYHLVDREWTAVSGADVELVAARALIYLAHDIIVRGVAHPWAPTATVREIATTLGTICGLSLDDSLIDRWIVAESALQSIIQDVERAHMEPIERRMLSTSRLDPLVRRSLPVVTLQRELGELQSTSARALSQVEALQQQLDAANESVAELQREVWGARDYTITVASEISELRRENLVLSHDYQAVLRHVEGLEKIREHQEEIYASATWRLGSALLRPLHRLRHMIPMSSNGRDVTSSADE